MALAFRNFADASKTAGSGLQLVLPVPSGVQDGDVLIAFVLAGGSANLPGTPSGWTALDNQTTGPSVQSYFKIAASEPASYSFTVSDSQSAVGIMSAYTGGASVSTINAHGAFHRTVGSATITADSITTNVDGCMLIFVGGSGAATTVSGPTSWNQRDVKTNAGLVCVLADLLQATQGATGTVTATAGASGNTQGSMLAIAPAAAAAAQVPGPPPVLGLQA